MRPLKNTIKGNYRKGNRRLRYLFKIFDKIMRRSIGKTEEEIMKIIRKHKVEEAYYIWEQRKSAWKFNENNVLVSTINPWRRKISRLKDLRGFNKVKVTRLDRIRIRESIETRKKLLLEYRRSKKRKKNIKVIIKKDKFSITRTNEGFVFDPYPQVLILDKVYRLMKIILSSRPMVYAQAWSVNHNYNPIFVSSSKYLIREYVFNVDPDEFNKIINDLERRYIKGKAKRKYGKVFDQLKNIPPLIPQEC